MDHEAGKQPEPVRERVEAARPDLTPDERTVLEIAYHGESIAAIGRWENPILALVARGLMRSNDFANNVITDAGRKAFETADDKALGEFVDKAKELESAKLVAQKYVEFAAQDLAKAARVSSRINGDAPEEACRQWAKLVLERALELVRGRS